MMELLQFSLCLCAFNCFALAKFNHYRDVFQSRPSEKQSKLFLVVAWITILLSLVLCVLDQAGYGALLFSGYMALSVLILIILYSFTVTWVKQVNVINLSVVLLSSAVLMFF
ncbi:DUF3325 domain-containing protein [Pseudoalteromonas mariniglutinosa]|uniref:DUF3325 domain-containing protein n=1 Tax=Pseudoalteromonas mariniglutinosa TaxID=206042 RepID=UPI00384B72BE